MYRAAPSDELEVATLDHVLHDKLTLPGNLETSSEPSLLGRPSQSAAPTVRDPLRPSWPPTQTAHALNSFHDHSQRFVYNLSRFFPALLFLSYFYWSIMIRWKWFVTTWPAPPTKCNHYDYQLSFPRLLVLYHRGIELCIELVSKMALYRPVARLLCGTNLRSLSSLARRHYSNSSAEVPQRNVNGPTVSV